MKNFPVQTIYFNLCTPANIFFEMQTIFLTHIVFANNLFVLLGPANNFSQS